MLDAPFAPLQITNKETPPQGGLSPSGSLLLPVPAHCRNRSQLITFFERRHSSIFSNFLSSFPLLFVSHMASPSSSSCSPLSMVPRHSPPCARPHTGQFNQPLTKDHHTHMPRSTVPISTGINVHQRLWQSSGVTSRNHSSSEAITIVPIFLLTVRRPLPSQAHFFRPMLPGMIGAGPIFMTCSVSMLWFKGFPQS